MKNQNEDIQKAKKLGLGGARKLSSSTSFLEEKPSTDNFFSQDYTLDFESVGNFTESEPALVVRKQVDGEIKSNSDIYFAYESRRVAKDKKYYFSVYKFFHKLIGNFSFFSFPSKLFSASGNNFFKKYSNKKLKFLNGLPFVRLSFPKFASNTSALKVRTASGLKTLVAIDKDKAKKGKISKSDSNKNYLEWNNSFFHESSNDAKTRFNSANRPNLFSGFYIPYPNTVDIQQYNKFNIPLKIAAYGNDTKIEGGLLVISTGNNLSQQICYVSPHIATTGFANTVETFKVTKKAGVFQSKKFATRDQIILSTGFSNASFPSNLTGVYEEIPFLNKFGKKTFAKSISSTGLNSNPNFIIQWSGSTNENIPANVSGQWILSSGRLAWFNNSGSNTEKTNLQLQQSGEVGFLKYLKSANLYSSGPIVNLNQNAPATSSQWKKLSDNTNAGSLIFNYSKKEELSRKPITFFNNRNEDAAFQVKSFFLDSKNVNSGLLPSGINLELKSGFKFLVSGDSEIVNISGDSFSYEIEQDSHLKQDAPLIHTDFYRFYNKLYSKNTNKTIATGTWNGIIPAGTSFSLEFISTKFNEKVGLNKDLYIIYSGYGTEDFIDLKSKKYLNTRFAKDDLKKVKYEESAGALSYTSHVAFENSEKIENFSRKTATKKIQGYIYRIMKKYIPESVFRNSKMKRFQRFLEIKASTVPQSGGGASSVSGLPDYIIDQNQV